MTEQLYYDLHLHSCLSPCGDNDMTPSNIAGMAALKGLDVIALIITPAATARLCCAQQHISDWWLCRAWSCAQWKRCMCCVCLPI